ncbi:MAG: O-antigen ligase family protein [Solirubrobacterales bacterium]
MTRPATAAPTRKPILLAVGAAGLVLGLVVARVPLAGIALVIAGIGAAVVLTRPDLVLLAMIAALPWENMLHYPSAQLSTVKGIGAAVFLAYAVKLFGDRKAVVRMPLLLAIVTGLGLWVGMTMALSTDPGAGMHKLIRWALFLAFFFLVVQLVDGRPQIDRVLRVFALSVGAAGAYTLYLFVGGEHGYRAAGPLEDPNDLAYLIGCTLPIMAYLFKAEPHRRLLWGACFVLGTGAMLSTFSRGALVGVGALLVWGIVTRRIPFRAILAGVLTGLVLVALAFTVWKPFFDEALHQKEHIADHNIESRESRWAAAAQLGSESPVFGIGTGLYPVKSLPILRDDTGYLPEVTVPQTVAHNTYLEIFAENGLPGLALFVAYLVVAWLLLRKSRRMAISVGDERAGWLITALQSSLVIAIVAGTFLSEELTSPYWLLGALAAVLAQSFETAPATEVAATRRLPYVPPALPVRTPA